MRMDPETIRKINQAVYFMSREPYEAPEMKPWQVVTMEYERVNLLPPSDMPRFASMEDAEIWMCLDSRYNSRVRMCELAQAG